MNPRRLLSQAALVTGALLFSAGLQTFAFTQPSTSPPNADSYAPLTTSPTAQSKQGGLLLNTGGATNGLIVQSGNVGIGISSPSQMLDVAGYVRAASGVCIGSDCRTSWPASSAETDPTVQSWAKSGSPNIPGSVTVGGRTLYSGALYLCNCNIPGWLSSTSFVTTSDVTGQACEYGNGWTMTVQSCSQLQ